MLYIRVLFIVNIYICNSVVDSGFVKLRWFDCNTWTDSLVIVPVSQASAEQRAGRAGRVKPG